MPTYSKNKFSLSGLSEGNDAARITWSTLTSANYTNPFSVNNIYNFPYQLASNGNIVVGFSGHAGGEGEGATFYPIARTTNLVNWTTMTLPVPDGYEIGETFGNFINGHFIFGVRQNQDQYKFYLSQDGITWTGSTTLSMAGGTPQKTLVIYSKKFNRIIVGHKYGIYHSSDFTNWTTVTFISQLLGQGNIYEIDNKVFFYDYNGNKVSFSTDLINWTTQTSQHADVLFNIMYNDNIVSAFVNTSPYTMVYSTNGINWTNTTYTESGSGFLPILYADVAGYFKIDNTLYRAGTINNIKKVISSEDGINWTSQSYNSAIELGSNKAVPIKHINNVYATLSTGVPYKVELTSDKDIHYGPTTTTTKHEVWMYAANNSNTSNTLWTRYGSTSDNTLTEIDLEAQSGLVTILPGILLEGDSTPQSIKTSLSSSNTDVKIFGHVNIIEG